VGVSSVSTADEQPEQQELFSDPYDRQKKVEKVVNSIRAKGSRIEKASLIDAVPEMKKREEKRFSSRGNEHQK
jgi:hypothetical protein